MANDELELDVEQSSSGGMKKIIIIVAVLILLNVAGIGGWIYMSSAGNEQDSKSEEVVKEVKPRIYLSLDPEFVVNFSQGSKAKFLQVELQVVAREESVLEQLRVNMPVVRNDILLLLSSQQYEDLKSRAGKEQLQKMMLDTVNKILVDQAANSEPEEEGKSAKTPALVENIYFTSFIMQ